MRYFINDLYMSYKENKRSLLLLVNQLIN